MKLLCLDPGKTTGVAVLEINDKKPHPIYLDETKDVTLTDIAELFRAADLVVCENFLTRPNKARKGAFDWSDMVAPRVIGAATTLSKLYDVPLVLQSPAIKPTGYGFANLKYVRGKQGVHIQDAVAHGMYYAVKHQLCGPVSTKLL